MQFFAGMLLADIQVNFSDSSSSRTIHESKERSENDHFLDFPQRKSSERFGTVTALLGLLRPILSPFLIFIGLVFASYPEHNPEWVGWSRALHSFSTYIIPPNKDTCRYMTAFGVSFIALGIHFSPRARALLSNRLFLWLGKNSWAVYLLHGTLIRTVVVWMLYGMTMPADVAVTNDEGETHMEMGHLTMRGPFAQVILIPIWFCLVYICAEGWMRVVDPICSRWASAIEKFMVGEDGERNLGLLR
jgi:peptidoglycan/LPS O-acetylase OafA/YrhL